MIIKNMRSFEDAIGDIADFTGADVIRYSSVLKAGGLWHVHIYQAGDLIETLSFDSADIFMVLDIKLRRLGFSQDYQLPIFNRPKTKVTGFIFSYVRNAEV